MKIYLESHKNKNKQQAKETPTKGSPNPQIKREIRKTTQFKKDMKKVRKYPAFKQDFFDELLDKIVNNEELPAKCKTHQQTASGVKYWGKWNTHVYPNIVLIYDPQPSYVSLERIGSHNDLGLTEELDTDLIESIKLVESKQDIQNFIDKFGEERWETLQRCKSKIDNPKVKDITWLVAHVEPVQLDKFLDKYYTRQQRIEDDIKRVSAMPEADRVEKFENNGITFYHILTPEASVKYGLGTEPRARWCISGGYYDGSERDGAYGGVLEEAKYYFKEYLDSDYTDYYFAFAPDGNKYAICRRGNNAFDIWEATSDTNIGDDIVDSRTGEVLFGRYYSEHDCGWNDNPIFTNEDKGIHKELPAEKIASNVIQWLKIALNIDAELEDEIYPKGYTYYIPKTDRYIRVIRSSALYSTISDLLARGLKDIVTKPVVMDYAFRVYLDVDAMRNWIKNNIAGTNKEEDNLDAVFTLNTSRASTYTYANNIAKEKYGTTFARYIAEQISDGKEDIHDWVDVNWFIQSLIQNREGQNYFNDGLELLEGNENLTDFKVLEDDFWLPNGEVVGFLMYPGNNKYKYGHRYEQ